MPKLRLSLACWDYDRTRALQDGRVRVEGVDLDYLSLPVEETFFRMMRHREFDAAEMSLSSYTLSCSCEPRRFVAIPVFVSRAFRHSFVFVNENAGIREPSDLRGKRVGLPEYQLTALVWIRGILADHYGVPIDSVTYHTGGLEDPGRVEKTNLQLPPQIRVTAIPQDKTLARMLADGELDAVYAPRIPSTFGHGVTRLFSDVRSVESAYFEQTKIFPIMHVVALRRELYEDHRWIAQSLYKGFLAAREVGLADLDETAALKVAVPWLTIEVEATRRLMGHDYWTYGVEPNRHVLETFLRYHHEQALSPRRLDVEDLFAPETLEAFKI